MKNQVLESYNKMQKVSEGWGMGMLDKKKPTRFDVSFSHDDGPVGVRNNTRTNGMLTINATSPEDAKERVHNKLTQLNKKNIVISSIKGLDEDYNPLKADEVPPAPQTDPMDLVTMDIPLLIRLFELMHEDVQDDAELHEIATRILEVSKQTNSPLTMEHYNEILNGNAENDKY